MTQPKHLILGSSGQIGHSLCHLLNKFPQFGQYLEYDIAKNPKHDLRQPSEYLRYCIEEADYIYFLAFDVGGSRYLKERDGSFDFIHNNMAIMYQTFDILKDYPGKRLLFSSTQMSSMNHSVYGRLKSVGESYTLAYGGLVVKFWNIFGVEKDPNKFHVITDFIRSALQIGKINMMTDGSESRQFLHASCACLAMLELLMKDSYVQIEQRDNLHITSFQWTKIYDLALLIASIIEEKIGRKIEVNLGTQTDTVQNSILIQPNDYIKNHTEAWYRSPLCTDLYAGIGDIVDYEIQNANL